MTLDILNSIKDRVKNKASSVSSVEVLVDLARETGCVADIIGREYEVRDSTGKLVYTVRQLPMKVIQLNTLLKALNSLREKEKKQMPKGKGRRR